jgi:hypothetical protein
VTDSSSGGFGLNQEDVNEATSLMSNLTSSGTEVSKALGVLDPLVFGVIGSSVGATNTSMENAVLQTLQGVLNLFSNTSSDVQTAMSTYASADSAVADTLSSLANAGTSMAAPPDDIPADDIPADEMPGVLDEEFSLPAEGILGDLAEMEGMPAGLDSAVFARLAGSDEMLAEFAEEAESSFMSLFRSVGGGPSAVSERWNGLTEEEQEEAIATDGATIGSLDGIPGEVRDLVNTDALADLITETEEQIGELRNAAVQADKEHDDDEAKALLCLQQAAILQVQLGGLQALRDQLQASPAAYLLAIGTDAKGTGRCVVALNNPDTADNVATLVPAVRTGLSDGLTGTSGYAAAAASLIAAASRADRSQATSVVIWANYSVPLFGKTEAPASEPQAARVLAQFQGGLYSTNVNGSHLHTTVIGHGAGSAVIGAAAKLPGSLSADDIIALGSPGLDRNASAAAGSSGSSAADNGSHVWLYAGESGGNGPAGSVDYFGAASSVMPDMASIIVGNYDSIYHLHKQ